MSPREWMQWYLAGDYERITASMIDILAHYEAITYTEIPAALQTRIDSFAGCVLFFFTQPDFRVPKRHARNLVALQHVLANVVAMSAYGTTDSAVELLLRQENNYVKLLTLYSVRNRIWIERQQFFDADPSLASLWYATYSLCTQGTPSELLDDNLRRHLKELDPRAPEDSYAQVHLYFASTYVEPGRDAELKPLLNRQMQQDLGHLPIVNRPRRESIAIATAKWWPSSAVYKSMQPLVETLNNHYRLTLIHLGPKRAEIDESMFDRVLHVEMKERTLDIGCLRQNDFQLVYYPDIGMTNESIWMSNIRLAPIQVTSYGHPVSTFGSRIDYFIGGADSEVSEKAGEHYSERLVLIPGIGAHPVWPNYEPLHPQPNAGVAVVTCPWGCAKFNYRMLCNLNAIAERSRKKVSFQFLPNWGLERYNCVVPFVRDISAVLGSSARIIGNREYPEYMRYMEASDLMLDSHPFGGYNTVVDTLYLRKPMITYEGEHFYNRAASALMRKVGLEELIAHSDEEYIEKAVRLVDDEDYRRSLCERLEKMDLKAMLCDTDEPQYFRKAIDYLIENHERLQKEGSREPIFIRRAA